MSKMMDILMFSSQSELKNNSLHNLHYVGTKMQQNIKSKSLKFCDALEQTRSILKAFTGRVRVRATRRSDMMFCAGNLLKSSIATSSTLCRDSPSQPMALALFAADQTQSMLENLTFFSSGSPFRPEISVRTFDCVWTILHMLTLTGSKSWNIVSGESVIKRKKRLRIV